MRIAFLTSDLDVTNGWGRYSAGFLAEARERHGVEAVRVPDPFFGVRGPWIVRRLGPDCTRIELADLPRKRDEHKLLRAMGFETANVHLGTRRARVRQDLKRRKARWLERAAAEMADAIADDWRRWRRGRE